MKIDFNAVGQHLPSEIDVFIASIGFEARSASVVSNLSGLHVEKALVFSYPVQSSAAIESLQRVFKDTATYIDISPSTPIETADAIYRGVNGILGNLRPSNVVVDITTFHREALLILFRVLKEKNQQIKSLHIVYTPAAELNREWLSKGVADVRTVLGYAGEMLPSKPLHAVIVLGFELERARSLLEAYEPDIISIGVGTNPINTEFQSRNEHFIDQLVSSYGPEVKKFDICLSDPFEARDDLAKYLDRYTAYNTVVAPMNNKLSTVGVGLLVLRRPDIQICYAEAAIYNDDAFSQGGQSCYVFSVKEW